MIDQPQPHRQDGDGLSSDQQFENMVLAAIHTTLPSACIAALTVTVSDIQRLPISTILFAKEILAGATPSQSREAAEGAGEAHCAACDGRDGRHYVDCPIPERLPPKPALDAMRDELLKAKAAVAYLIEHIEYSDSYGVEGSGFMACHLCSGGGAPGVRLVHDATCPVRRCEAVAGEWVAELNDEREDSAAPVPSPDDAGETRLITDADREYASELLADLTSDDLPHLEIAARWFRKARVERSLSPSPAVAAEPETEQQFEDRLHKEDARDMLRLIDYIADKIGLPHNEELSRDNFNAWLANSPLSSEGGR